MLKSIEIVFWRRSEFSQKYAYLQKSIDTSDIHITKFSTVCFEEKTSIQFQTLNKIQLPELF